MKDIVATHSLNKNFDNKRVFLLVVLVWTSNQITKR